MDSLARSTALVIDDVRLSCEASRRVLLRAGVGTVHIALSGSEGFQKLLAAEPHYDLVFLDLHMPALDGIQLIRLLQAAGKHPRLVLMSDRGSAVLRAAARMGAQNICGTLQKPLTLEAVQELLAKLLGSEASHRRPVAAPPEEQLSLPELDEALERDEFRPLYQPKVRIRDGALTGVEALARLFRSTGEVVLPARFIPVAEAAGRITRLTMHLLQRVLGDLRHWRVQGLHTRVSLNLSAELLNERGLPDDLEALVHFHGGSPEHLVLEITESRMVQDAPDVTEVLARLALKGFELSVDDFGTGYASLDLLSRMPVSELKIDQRFVQGAAHDASLSTLQASAAQLSSALGLRTVAEGVETQEDWAVAARHGCDEAQGYLIARPMPAEQVLDWATHDLRALFVDLPSGVRPRGDLAGTAPGTRDKTGSHES